MTEYDVLGNERHKAICELAKMPDKYPNVDHVCMADLGAWKNELAQAIGAKDERFATIRDRLIHLLGGDRKSIDLSSMTKEDEDELDAGGRDETRAGDTSAPSTQRDCSGRCGRLAEDVAPITTKLRRYMEAYKPLEDGPSIVVSRIGTIGYAGLMDHCDSIDAIYAQLERDYKMACDVNERQDKEYVRLKEDNDALRQKVRDQSKQLTDVQLALERRNKGELKTRWQKELDKLKAKNADMAEFCERVEQAAQAREDVMLWGVSYTALPVDADGVPIHVGDVMEWIDIEGTASVTCTVEAVGTDCFFAWDKLSGRFVQKKASAYRHYHAPTVEDVLREFTDAVLEWAGKSGTVTEVGTWSDVAAEYAAKLRLRDADA